MAEVGTGADTGESRYGLWLAIALLGAASFLTVLAIDTRQYAPERLSAPEQAVAAHCAQFVALAKASYGSNWKVRLDPRDPLCALHIQQVWESERIPRESSVEAIRTGPITQPAASGVTEAALQAAAARPGTYCLNVISLARAKFGAEWSSRIAPEDAAHCQEQIQKTLGR